jgi:hypothetical protein
MPRKEDRIMTDIKAIAPGAIETYAGELNAGVDKITEGLNALCSAITNVNYGGRNAFKFKTDTSALANKLSTTLHEALTTLSKNVAAATTDLSGSLGGSAITISLKDNTITPADAGADTDDGVASMSGLKTLGTQVTEAFNTISQGVGMVANMPPNSPAGWMGDRRNLTQGHVNDFVSVANGNCRTTQTSLTDFISSQMTALDGQ